MGSIISKIISLKRFQISSTQLPLLAHHVNLPLRKLCRSVTFVLWYTGTNLSTWCHGSFLPILLVIVPRNGHWSPEYYCKWWTHFRAGQGKRQAEYPLGSGYLLPECNRFPIPLYLVTHSSSPVFRRRYHRLWSKVEQSVSLLFGLCEGHLYQSPSRPPNYLDWWFSWFPSVTVLQTLHLPATIPLTLINVSFLRQVSLNDNLPVILEVCHPRCVVNTAKKLYT
jgi:hypothetical protein